MRYPPRVRTPLFGILLGGLLLLSSCGSSDRITVTVQGLPDDSLVCSYVTPAIIRDRGQMVSRIAGGTRSGDKIDFSLDFPDNSQIYKVYLMPQSYRGDGPRQNIEIFLLPGETLHIDATYEPKHKVIQYTVSGSPVQQAWEQERTVFAPLEDQLGMTGAMLGFASEAGMRDTLMLRMKTIGDSIQSVKAAYIGAHPAEQLSAYYLTTINEPHSIDSLYRLLGDDVKDGPFKAWLDLQNEMIGQVLTSEQARAGQITGAAVPDFTLPDVKGGEFTLSSLYGGEKYIVLDFWGTWCSWCMKGMPEMKKAYTTHSTVIEIVGIDCGDKESVWKKSVGEQQLPWINVRAEGDDIPVRYGVEAFPTKIILDPQGSVVSRFTGEDPAFYTTLDSLVNQR